MIVVPCPLLLPPPGTTGEGGLRRAPLPLGARPQATRAAQTIAAYGPAQAGFPHNSPVSCHNREPRCRSPR